jgi:hypothetical protein
MEAWVRVRVRVVMKICYITIYFRYFKRRKINLILSFPYCRSSMGIPELIH